jgi:hypothetical protein
MAYYVVLTVNVVTGTPNAGNTVASVQQFANAAAYTQTVGDTPTHVDPNQPANGYPTQALAQAEANRWNSKPASQKLSGTTPNPNADTVLPPGFKLPNVLGGFNLSGWFLRVGEILLGLVLVGVGLARLTHTQNIISQAVKTRIL